jgi:hypothetical protein
MSTGRHFQNGRHNTAKIQHCSISKVAFKLFFKLVVCGRFNGQLKKFLFLVTAAILNGGWGSRTQF